MNPNIKSKPIPFSSVQAQCTQLLKQKQPKLQKAKTRQDEDDYIIPDEYSTIRTAEGIPNKGYTFMQNSTRSKNNKPANTFNQTYSSMNNSNTINIIGSGDQRLTHGLTSYKDIKSSFHAHNDSGSKDKERQSINQSGSKSKRPLKLQEEYLNKCDADSAQCTFTPKTNTNASQSYRSFKDFVNFQENFLSRRQQKVQKMKKELEQKEIAEMTMIPAIDKKSKKMSECTTEYHMDSRGSLKKSDKKSCTYDRLYKIPRKKDRIYEQESSFTPKILNKSKSLVRNDKVENLLYEDAQRRIGQQKLIESEVYKKQSLLPKYPACSGSAQKKIKVQNQLICKKIRGEFMQLLQASWPEDPEDQESALISPILAVTILSQLFNVELNPNKNEELCWLIVSYLVDDNNQTQDRESESDKSAANGNVETKRLWEFIKAIVVGTTAYQKGVSSFSEQQFQKINSQLGYFYSLRLSKWPNRMEQAEEEPQYKIQTSKNTNKLAEAYRQKRLQQISQFISDTKVGQPVSSLLASKNNNVNEQTQLIQQRIIRLQDLFILDSIRKKAQLEQQRLRNEEIELKNCTFRPSLNQKTYQKAIQRKTRSRSKQNLRTVAECQVQQTKELQVKQKNKKIVIKSKNNQNRSSLAEERMSAFKQNNTGQTCRNIKDVDKTLLRLNIARKMKDVEQTHKQRGYNFKTSNNWLKCAQEQKKQILGQVSNFLGYKDSSVQKDRNFNENYQSCQLK